MKKTVLWVAITYCILYIAFELIILYSGSQFQPIGKLSKMILLFCMLPAIIIAIYLKRKNNGGTIGGKEAVREGLFFILISIAIVVVFEYIYFVTALKDYTFQHRSSMTNDEILNEAMRFDKKITLEKALEYHKEGLKEINFSASFIIIPMLAFGMFASFVSAVFMKRG